MGLRIQNNITALTAHKYLNTADKGLTKSLERLSSGYRINRAADDAAGLSISQAFRADIVSYQSASRNVAEANSLLQVAEGALDQIGNMLTRLKELATQASSANAGSNLDKINAEGNALLNEVDRISAVTEYAGSKLLDGSFGVSISAGTFTSSDGLVGATGMQSATTYHVTVATSGGGDKDWTVTATIGGQGITQTITDVSDAGTNATAEVTFDALGLTITYGDNLALGTGSIIAATATASEFQVGAKDTINDRIGVLISGSTTTDLNLSTDQLTSASTAQSFLTDIDNAISTLNNRRGTIGAAQNRMAYAASNLASTVENVQAAESVIRDVDMAAEMITFTKNQILLQAGTAMLAQANMAPQNVLQLLG